MSSKKSIPNQHLPKRIKSNKVDVYDQWRPPPGIKYHLSETEANLNAYVPRVHLKYTTVEYEPGQDLSAIQTVDSSHISEKPRREAKKRGRGPVWKFIEEIEAEKIVALQKNARSEAIKKEKARKRNARKQVKGFHKTVIKMIGPEWFHEMSPKQFNSADALKDALLKDNKFGTIINTQETLGNLGIVLWPNHTKIKYLLKKYYLCPVEFLLGLFKINRPKNPENDNTYTLNDKILLSAVVHLTIRETFRELHLRIPSPPRGEEIKYPRRTKSEMSFLKKLKMARKISSPYLKPIVFRKQRGPTGVYKNRHKEYPSIKYFDYVDDMYNVYWEDDLDSVVKRKETTRSKSRFSRPPKIPVRYIQSKLKKKKVYVLKKPSPYTTLCKPVSIFASAKSTKELDEINEEEIEEEMIEEEEEDEEEEIENNENTDKTICRCTPINLNRNQEPCPHTYKCRLKKEEERDEKSSNQPNINYSCDCIHCKKIVNIFPKNTQQSENLDNNITEVNPEPEDRRSSNDEEKINLKDFIEDEEEEYENYGDYKVCPCVSDTNTEKEHSLFSNLDDPYYYCTCKDSSTSFCGCCTCDQIEKNFRLKIQRYNQIYKTNYKPCTCNCKCKKHKQPPSKKVEPIKYCFCKTEKEIEESVRKEEEKIKEEVKKIKELKEHNKPRRIENEVEEIESSSSDSSTTTPDECACRQIFDDFIAAHDSCVSLYNEYKKKIKTDVENYLRDVRDNRCICGDSVSLLFENDKIKGDETIPNTDEKTECGCHCKQSKSKSKLPGCTCKDDSRVVLTCTCYDPVPKTTQDTCQCAEFVAQLFKEIKDEEMDEEAIEDEEETHASILENTEESFQVKSSLKTVTDTPSKGFDMNQLKDYDDEEYVSPEEIRGEDELVEIDPRIFVIDKFPKKRKKQMKLLKLALQTLADDGYPLAQLPNVHLLPHFQVWLDKRSGKYYSMKERDEFLRLTKYFMGHIETCRRKTNLPELPIRVSEKQKLTWGKEKLHKKMVYKCKTGYYRNLKQNYIDEAQEQFPIMYHYQFPNKTFRDTYFTYVASDENHIFVEKVWKPHECKDMLKHSCCK